MQELLYLCGSGLFIHVLYVDAGGTLANSTNSYEREKAAMSVLTHDRRTHLDGVEYVLAGIRKQGEEPLELI